MCDATDQQAVRVSLFLPTTGLHHLMLRELARPLVVTSRNLTDEPIATDDREARRTQTTVADGFLGEDVPALAAAFHLTLAPSVRSAVASSAIGCSPRSATACGCR
ncbi:Sua5/YciO/YrdC/YwlC family protein [Streptomyces atriruber]|uniref:Sua5/YciO/YrdC/YwlC family protein n=1 Tax=Streptomyces atriruber TaxID=545121 RepID=UPI0006E3EE15|nr:Sua5/YciO/YrdC/YwlC family protein [Streptomyces atriruber]